MASLAGACQRAALEQRLGNTTGTLNVVWLIGPAGAQKFPPIHGCRFGRFKRARHRPAMKRAWMPRIVRMHERSTPASPASLAGVSNDKAPLLVCFSHLRWDFVWQRPQHLLSRAAKQYRVLVIE